MSAKIAIRIVLLAGIVLGGFGYIAVGVLGFRLGSQPFGVTVDMRRSGGLFTGSYVAMRGVDIGRVTSMSITRTGVAAHLSIDAGSKIPAASTVAIRDLSAVGEQYVDFTPTAAADPTRGPWLRDGSVVDTAASGLPVPLEQVLGDASGFTNSISTTTFSQVLSSVTTALQGNGPELRSLLDSTERLFSTLEAVQPQTNNLIDSSQTLLATAAATNPDLANLSSLTAQLDRSNADLAAVLANGSAAATQVQSFLDANSAAIVSLTAHSATVADVFAAHDPAVQSLLQVLPSVTAALGSTVYNGAVHTHFFINDSEPTCTYPGASLGEPTAPSAALDLTRTCTAAAPTLQQRGSANAPVAGS